MRRTGKTSLLQWIAREIPSTNKLFLDLENPLNQRYFEETDYEKVAASLRFLGLDMSQPAFLFLDEIQLCKPLPAVLKYLIDHYAIKCFLTGSASFYLKNLFSESLVGRKYIFELFPLDFEEFLRFKAPSLRLPPPGPMSHAVYDTLSPLYEEYLRFGGFPEVVMKNSLEEKKKSLDDIFTSYFQLEVLRFGGYRKNKVVRDLMTLLLERLGSKIDVSKLAVELGVTRVTIKDYLSFLEDTYFIKLIRPFSRSKDLEIRKMAKVYACDSGIARHHSGASEGSLFENNIFQNLRMRSGVNFYQKKSGSEIDFILDKKIAIEVKIRPTASDLKKLEAQSRTLKLDNYKIISKIFTEDLAENPHVDFPFWV